MEDRSIDIMVGQGAGARALRLTLQPFTLVGATTRWSLLSKPLRDRFGMSFRLEHYGLDDLVAIVSRSARILEIEIDGEGAAEIAGRARGTPRVANRLLRRVRDYVQVHRGGRIDAEGARAALELMGVDAAGLERLDRELLNALAVTFRGRPVGITTLAAALGEDAGTIEEVYEPYLLQRGLLERTPQGRAITAAGLEHLGHPDTPGADARLFG
jgi:Holliday junction DNA helicase RuvB